MGAEPVTVVANYVHRHDQSIGLGIYDSDTAWQPDWNEAALLQAGSTSFCRVCRGTFCKSAGSSSCKNVA